MSNNNNSLHNSPIDIRKIYRRLLNSCKYVTTNKKPSTNMRCSTVINLAKIYTEDSILRYIKTAPRVKEIIDPNSDKIMNAIIITLLRATPENIHMLIKKELSPNNIQSKPKNYNTFDMFCRNKSRKNINDRKKTYGKSKKKNYTNRVSECKGNGLKRNIYTILSDSEINTENSMVIDYFKKNKKEDILDTIYNDFLSKNSHFLSKYSHYDNNKLKSFVNLWITRKQLNRIRNKKTVKFNNH